MCVICEGKSLEGFTSLDCSGCKYVTYIPDIKSLKILNVTFCRNLMYISNIKGLKTLFCHGCEKLTIPNIESLEEIHHDPRLYIPEEMRIRFRIGGKFSWKLKKYRLCVNNTIKKKKEMYNIPLPKDVIQYVICKY